MGMTYILQLVAHFQKVVTRNILKVLLIYTHQIFKTSCYDKE